MRLVISTFLIGLFLTASAFSGMQPEPTVWKTLSKITFRKQFDEMMGMKVDVPVFSQDVKALEGSTIDVRGYVIPVTGFKSDTAFVFSAFPYSSCFFCGGAGPETVMEVYSTEPVKYTTEAIWLRGTLQLNDTDINRLMYAITEAEQIEE